MILWVVFFLAGDKGLQSITEGEDGFELKHYSIDAVPVVFYIDYKNHLWIGTDQGLFRLNLTTGKLHSKETNASFPSEAIDDIQLSNDGKLWFSRKSLDSRFIIYDFETESFEAFDKIPIESPTRRTHFAFDKDNRLWVSVFGDQLYGYDFTDSMVFLKSSKNSNILKEQFIRRPYCDNYGNIWISTGNLCKYDFPRGFDNYQHPFPSYQTVTTILKEKNHTWIGYSQNGFIRIDDDGEVSYYNKNVSTPFKTQTDLIQRFLRLSNGNLLVIGFSSLMFLDKNHRIFKHIPLRGASKSIYEDGAHNIWVAGFEGLLKYTLDGEWLKTYTLPLLGSDDRQFIFSIAEDLDKNIWFGSNGLGLGKLNPTTEIITHYKPVEHRDSLHSPYVFDMLIDKSENLWLATNIGVVKYDVKQNKFRTYKETEGLQHHFVTGLLEDSNGLIWISMVSGLSALDPRNDNILNYSKADGLLNNNYYQGSRSQYNGTLYFGGSDGIDYFNPSELRDVYKKPALKITRLFVDQMDAMAEIDNNAIELRYNQDLIDIEFGATRFGTNNKTNYAYRVEGLVEDWVDLNAQRKILFSDLKPGEYQLQIKGAFNQTNWIEDILKLDIYVSTPFWQTTWFILASCLVLGLLIYLYIKYREQKAAKKEKETAAIKQKILSLEKKALLAQMNPHFIFNSMNAVQQFIAVKDNANAMRYLSKFSRLMRQVLNASARDEVTIFEEVRLIESYLELEKMRYPNRLKYAIQLEDDLNIQGLKIQPLLIQPYVEQATQNSLLNASGQSEIKVHFSKPNYDYLLVEIEDRSDQNAEYTEVTNEITESASIVEQRLNHVNKKLNQQKIKRQFFTDPANKQKGTKVELFIDLIYATKG